MKLAMADADSKYHWAYIKIVSTKTHFDVKRTPLASAERRWKTIADNITEAAATRRKLTENPHVDVETTNDIYDRFTACISEAQEYPQALYDDIDHLRRDYNEQEIHHESPEGTITPASSNTSAPTHQPSDSNP